jgi:hypothetical protein
MTSVRAVSTNRSAQAFARGLRGGILTAAMPALAKTASEGHGALPGPVAEQEPEARGAPAEVHQKIADLLGGPRPVRVRGDAGDMDVAAANLYHEEAVQALKGHRAVHVKEAGGEHRRGLGLQELPPRRVGVPLRRRRDHPAP